MELIYYDDVKTQANQILSHHHLKNSARIFCPVWMFAQLTKNKLILFCTWIRVFEALYPISDPNQIYEQFNETVAKQKTGSPFHQLRRWQTCFHLHCTPHSSQSSDDPMDEMVKQISIQKLTPWCNIGDGIIRINTFPQVDKTPQHRMLNSKIGNVEWWLQNENRVIQVASTSKVSQW